MYYYNFMMNKNSSTLLFENIYEHFICLKSATFFVCFLLLEIMLFMFSSVQMQSVVV